jgi:hypothetical protein
MQGKSSGHPHVSSLSLSMSGRTSVLLYFIKHLKITKLIGLYNQMNGTFFFGEILNDEENSYSYSSVD